MKTEELETLSSSGLLRNHLLNLIKNGEQMRLFDAKAPLWTNLENLPARMNLVNYFECVELCVQLTELIQESIYLETGNLLWMLVCQDSSRVPLTVAVAAWLTADSFRFPSNAVPEDLSYGLVLQYSRTIPAIAQFLIGYRALRSEPQTVFQSDTERQIITTCSEYARRIYYEEFSDEIRTECLTHAKAQVK